MKIRFEQLSDFVGPRRLHGYDTLIDVRSPAEYAQDHVPGAINLPVLDDEERARIGTMYKQQSPFDARVAGAALVAQNAARHLQGPLAQKRGDWKPLVYCWRGGQRSGSFATILAQVGWRVGLVEGGYKSWRRLVADALHTGPLSHRLVLIDGNTGTAKTQLLHRMQAHGAQVLDLEGLAGHRGSVFGPTAAGQPGQRAFESALAVALDAMDPARVVFAEAESSTIGNLQVPPAMWEAMKSAPRIEISAPLGARAEFLVRAYADIVQDRQRLSETLSKLTSLQGRERVAEWQALAAAGNDTDLAAALMQHHYDPRYARARARRGHRVLHEIALDDLAPSTLDRVARHLASLEPGDGDRGADTGAGSGGGAAKG